MKSLKRRVDLYFARTKLSRRDCPQMYIKTGVILCWAAACYIGLLFFAPNAWVAVPLAIVFGLAAAAIGFNIQHDASHQAYSKYAWMNKLGALTLELLGGSSYIWARKHNAVHHSYTNVTGHDDDINLGFLGRVSPHQHWLFYHRFQHFYLWFLYGFLAIKWHLIDDFVNVIKGRLGPHRFARPKGWDLAVFIGGKALFYSLAFVIPMLLHPAWYVIGLYVLVSFVEGITLSVVFQLAHCVEEAEFPMPIDDQGHMEASFAVHQVATTVDFSTHNPLVTWYTGGLNHQIEHHLFPHICHIHYPALAKMVERTCRKFGLRYGVNNSLFGAIASHYRWLRQMGTKNPQFAM